MTNDVTKAPDAKFWPEGIDTVEVMCPLCGASTKSFIGGLKASGAAGRVEFCRTCDKDFIVEAFEDGIVAFREQSVPFRVALKKSGIEKLERFGVHDFESAVRQIENQLNGDNGHIVDETGPWYVRIDGESSAAIDETDIEFLKVSAKQEAQAKVAAAEKACAKVQAAWAKASDALNGSVSANAYGIYHDEYVLRDKLLAAKAHIKQALQNLEAVQWPTDAEYDQL